MKKILITCATDSLGLRLAKALENKFEVSLSTSDELPIFMQDKYLKIPKGVNPTFAHELLKLALDTQCHYILPLQLSEIQSLSESILLFEEYGIEILSPTKMQLEDLEVLTNPEKGLPISLINNSKDLLTDQQLELKINGLGLVSDSGLEFILVVAK